MTHSNHIAAGVDVKSGTKIIAGHIACGTDIAGGSDNTTNGNIAASYITCDAD